MVFSQVADLGWTRNAAAIPSVPSRAHRFTAFLHKSSTGSCTEEGQRASCRLGAESYDPVLYSHEIGAAKPDPACYLLACQALDLPPGPVAMVDDVPEFIAGAHSVGMTTAQPGPAVVNAQARYQRRRWVQCLLV